MLEYIQTIPILQGGGIPINQDILQLFCKVITLLPRVEKLEKPNCTDPFTSSYINSMRMLFRISNFGVLICEFCRDKFPDGLQEPPV